MKNITLFGLTSGAHHSENHEIAIEHTVVYTACRQLEISRSTYVNFYILSSGQASRSQPLDQPC